MVGRENSITRGDVFFIHLDPTFGHEIGGYKVRPVVVVSINEIHQRTRIVTVIPATSSVPNHPLANVVRVDPERENGLREPSFFQCHQARAVDQGRMTQGRIGRLSLADMARIADGVRHSLGLWRDER